MFVKSALALAVAASSVAAAPLAARGGKQPPAGWAYDYLEDYMTYHTRYLALTCYEKHDTEFFQDCCRPMLATENLKDNRKAYCVPSKEATASVAASLSAKYSGATPTASAAASQETEEYCETEEAQAVSQAYETASTAAWSAPASSAAAASPSPSPAAQSQVGEQYRAAQPSTTTTSTQPAWTPEPTTQAPQPTTQAPQPTQQQSSGGGEVFSGGQATYYHQNGNPGACGNWNNDGAYIVAIDQARWGGSFGQQSATCGRWVRITNTDNGRQVTAQVQDVCPSCRDSNSLDLSVAAFQALGDLSQGVLPISYVFV